RFSSIELKRFPRARRWYPRGALVARVTAGADAIWAVSVHFGLGGAERAGQAESLTEMVATLSGGVVIVGGDLNATPDMRATARIAAVLRDTWSHAGDGEGPTFPAFAPAARIDYVFLGSAGTIIGAGVGAEGASEASDHLPVAVDLGLASE
ncbi:MAG: endonuclease/exonuclease/phosphatase family protein, partial [Actinomycetota bacterium]